MFPQDLAGGQTFTCASCAMPVALFVAAAALRTE